MTAPYTKEDLIDLVCAVKFSNPDASIRTVHREITEKMALNESFNFLKDVKLNDVKKVWKKANASLGESNLTAASDSLPAETNSKLNADNNQILKFYTVGDGSVRTLAQNYSAAAAETAAEKAALAVSKEKSAHEDDLKNYVHFFLDVPADRSGKRPHQALINFNDNNVLDPEGKKGKSKKKVRNSRGSQRTDASAKVICDNTTKENREIVKIQVAASLPGMVNVKTPMLLYNANRSAKTFIHPIEETENTSNADDSGYDKIHSFIREKGVGGALGSVGGTKGYFYCRISRRKNEQDIISIDVTSGLAHVQSW